MRFIRWSFLTLLVLAAGIVLCRGWLYRQLIRYEAAGPRPTYRATNPALISTLDSALRQHPNADVQEVVQLAQDVTSRQLIYRTRQTATDPNQLITVHRAHCVGYAAFCAAACNYLLARRHLHGSWQARPQVGQLYFLGENLHRHFSSPFFRDHDFVLLENRRTGEWLAVDPTVSDYLGIDAVALRR